MPRAEGLFGVASVFCVPASVLPRVCTVRAWVCSVPLGFEPSRFLRCLGSVGSWLSFLRLPALFLPWLCARCLACPCGVWRLLRLSSLGSSLSLVVSLPLSALLSAPPPRVFSGLRALAARPFSLLAPASVGPRPARGLSAWLCPVGPSLAVCLGASLSLRGFGRLLLAAWLPVLGSSVSLFPPAPAGLGSAVSLAAFAPLPALIKQEARPLVDACFPPLPVLPARVRLQCSPFPHLGRINHCSVMASYKGVPLKVQ